MAWLPGSTGQVLRFGDITGRHPDPMGFTVGADEDDVGMVVVHALVSRELQVVEPAQ